MQTNDDSQGDWAFDHWNTEHEAIDRYTANLSQWIASESKLRSLQFQETVKKLTELNEQLQAHFARERQLCQQMQDAHRDCPKDADAVQRQVGRDHTSITSRLKHVIDRMQDAEFEMDAWKKGVHELGLIIDLIEQHDEQESESVNCLLPSASLESTLDRKT